MLSKLSSDHFTHVVDRLNIYTTLRFVATCTTVRTATKERVDNRPEMVLKTVAFRLVDDFAGRFNATPGLDPEGRSAEAEPPGAGRICVPWASGTGHACSCDARCGT